MRSFGITAGDNRRCTPFEARVDAATDWPADVARQQNRIRVLFHSTRLHLSGILARIQADWRSN